MLDIIIKNGTVYDGLGSAGRKADVAIEKGKITEIAPKIAKSSAQVINADGKFVAPGFIDVQNHSDSYWTFLDQPNQLSLLSQGITTIIIGNCGSSLAPLLSPESIKSIQKWHSLEGINLNWTSLGEFLDYLDQIHKGLNVGTLVGHATLKRGLLGDQNRMLRPDERKIILKSLRQALEQGALGLSLGLIYAHEVNSTADELSELVDLLKLPDKYLSVHLRSEASHILESLDEVLELAVKSAVKLKIAHLKVRGKKNWHLFDQVCKKLETAYSRGAKVCFDVYPYDTSWSVLYTYLPKWAYEGGRKQILELIAEPISRRKVLDYLKASGHDFENIIISEASGSKNFVGKTIKQIAMNQSVSAEEAVLNVIAATNAQVVVFDHNLQEKQVQDLCTHPLSLISTDGAGFGPNHSLVHPRCFGTMSRFLKIVREKKLMKWEQALTKITSEPAKLLGLTNRGTLEKNSVADVTIFDPQTVADKATYENPNLLSEGIDMVLVGGKLAYADKKAVNLNGQVLRR